MPLRRYGGAGSHFGVSTLAIAEAAPPAGLSVRRQAFAGEGPYRGGGSEIVEVGARRLSWRGLKGPALLALLMALPRSSRFSLAASFFAAAAGTLLFVVPAAIARSRRSSLVIGDGAVQFQLPWSPRGRLALATITEISVEEKDVDAIVTAHSDFCNSTPVFRGRPEHALYVAKLLAQTVERDPARKPRSLVEGDEEYF